jgi:hypothetical protein
LIAEAAHAPDNLILKQCDDLVAKLRSFDRVTPHLIPIIPFLDTDYAHKLQLVQRSGEAPALDQGREE